MPEHARLNIREEALIALGGIRREHLRTYNAILAYMQFLEYLLENEDPNWTRKLKTYG